jgi:hypothetical protein
LLKKGIDEQDWQLYSAVLIYCICRDLNWVHDAKRNGKLPNVNLPEIQPTVFVYFMFRLTIWWLTFVNLTISPGPVL